MTTIAFLKAEQRLDFQKAVSAGFGGDHVEKDDSEERFFGLFPLETCIAAFDERERMVGTFSSFDLDLAVPGGSLPMAGTTVVTVHPSHRRQGLLTEMMTMHLNQAVERGQPMAGLWASETTIYGRFGYGPACEFYSLSFDAGRVTLPPGPSMMTVRRVDEDDARTIFPAIHAARQALVPGCVQRTENWWEHAILYDPEHWRRGATAYRYVVAYDGDQPAGYAIFRQKSAWTDQGMPTGEVLVREVVTLDDDARRTLWHHLAHVDLYPLVKWEDAPLDHPILIEVPESRQLTKRRGDSLWLRILDVPAALQGRTYERDGSLVIDVTDDMMGAAGRWRLDVDGGKGTCTPTDDDPDVQMSIAELGRLYLGGGSAVQLARAQLVHGTSDGIAGLDHLFRTATAPYCLEHF